jgi:transcriptional regulator with XRE-family HTH domain
MSEQAKRAKTGGLPISKRVCDALTTARERRGLTQQQLAAKLRISNVHLCTLERCKQKPSYEMLRDWCKAVGYKVHLDIRPTMKEIVRQLNA